MKVVIAELENLVKRALTFYGYNEEETSIIKDILLYAQLRGNNQGIVKLIGKGIPKNPNASEIKIIKETKLSAFLNGNKNMGMIVMKKATEIAIKKAQEHGFGMAGTNDTSSSTGAIGYYVKEIAENDLIGFAFAGSPETVSTHGSYEPIFGTNPLAIGVPSKDGPIVLDMATAAMAYYGLIEAKTAGRSIPPDIAYDSEGKLTTDPAKAMDGALRPFDKNYKGAGLSLMVEVLTGPLVAATFTGIGEKNNWGNLVLALDPELLTDRNSFLENVSLLVKKVRNTKKLPGVERIYTPGERGDELAKKHSKAGEIEIEDNLFKELQKVANSQKSN